MTKREVLVSAVMGVLGLCVSGFAQHSAENGEGAVVSLPARLRTESAASLDIDLDVYERLANSEDGAAFVKITLEPPIPQSISTREEREAWYAERQAALLNSLTEGEHRDGWFEGDFQKVFRSGSVLFGFVSHDGLGKLANPPVRKVEQSKVARFVLEEIRTNGIAQVMVALPPAPDALSTIERMEYVRRIQARVLRRVRPEECRQYMKLEEISSFAAWVDEIGLLKLDRNPEVLGISPDYKVEPAIAESVPFIKANQVHTQLKFKGKGIRVAVIDTGIVSTQNDVKDDIHRKDMVAILPDGYLTILEGVAPEVPAGTPGAPPHLHGTLVSAIITAPNGVAPDAEICMIRAIDQNGGSAMTHTLMAVNWAYLLVLNGTVPNLRLINLSVQHKIDVGQPGNPQWINPTLQNCKCDGWTGVEKATLSALVEQLKLARGKGVIAFGATGNDHECDKLGVPSCISHVIPVVGVYDNGQGYPPTQPWGVCTDAGLPPNLVMCLSNRSSSSQNCKLIGAPGYRITAGGTTGSGTSVACPHATGVAALMLQKNKTLKTEDVWNLLYNNGVLASSGNQCEGPGTVKTVDALSAVNATPSPPAGGSSGVGNPAGGAATDANDSHIFFACFTGPASPLGVDDDVCNSCDYPASPPDGDVDLLDFAQFQRQFTGPPKGACCSLEDGTCSETTFIDCYPDGIYQGSYTSCGGPVCPFGACCFADGTCANDSELDCMFADGIYLGDGTRCENDTCPEIRYRNTDALSTVHAPGAGIAMADDIILEGGSLCGMEHYGIGVLGGGGDVTAGLYTDCPGNGGTLIEGTEKTWTDIPFDGNPVYLDANLDIPVTLPANNQVWLVVEFSEPSSGWIFAGQAEAGFGYTADIFGKDLPPWGCNGYFPGNYAGFWANVACVDPAGACCLGNGSCVQVDTPEDCAGLGGLYAGSGLDCVVDAVDCTGACCAGDGSCTDVARDSCSAEEYQGDGVDCLAGTCIGACCLPDETCSELGADACATAGGYYRGHGTVCQGSNCNRGACCVVGPCMDVTEEECPGFYLGDETTCPESTCPTMGACCRDDVCTEETEDDCADGCDPMLCILAEGHTWNEGVACSADPYPCASPPPPGACCLEFGDCVDGLTPLECADQNGTFKGSYSLCSELICAQPPTGACCFDSAPCVEDQTEAQCVFNGGEFLGTLYGCTPDPCGPTGACCMPNGDCVADQTSAQCIASGGTYWGNATLCDPINPCPEPTGACCMSNNTCLDLQTVAACEFAGGSYQGDFSVCAGLNCKVTGACCLPAVDCETDCDGPCGVLTASACAYQSGGFAGDGTKCLGLDCSDCNDGPTAFGTCQTDERTQVVADDAAVNALFGQAVSLSGDMALVGAPDDETNGSAYVISLGNADCSVGQTKLRASNPQSGGFFGKAVAMSGDTAVVADPTVFLGAQEGVGYVFMKPPLGWGASMVESATLLLSDPATSIGKTVSVAINEAEDIILFGRSVDCEGTCICNPSEFGCGSVYVYHRPPLGWGNNTEDFILSASDANEGSGDDFFGDAVSISGRTALVGAPWDGQPGMQLSGSAYIFRFNGTNWIPEAKLTACDANGGQHFGTSVSISGDVAVVGAPEPVVPGGAAGSAYVFRFDPQAGEWHQEAKLTASDGVANDEFGHSVSVSGDVAIIGAWHDDEVCPDPAFCNSGSAYVFRFDGLDWNEEARFNASDISQYDHFGISVSISGDRALVGAELGEAEPSGVTNSGAAYVFEGLGDCNESQTTDLCDIINDPSLDCCPPHDCCETGHGAGCSDAGIAACVCGENLDCCISEWDAECVALVESIPCGTCDPGGNGIIDTCEDCPPDLDDDGDIDAADLAELLGTWGPCPGGCPEDLSGDCEVDALDMAILLGCWGTCPCSAQAQWNGGPDRLGALRFALGGRNDCLSLEEAVQMMGHDDVAAFIEWVLSEVPPDWVYRVAQFLLWLLNNWPC